MTAMISLRRKMTLQIGAMIVGLLLVSAAALWGLNALHQDYGLALAKYQELRQLFGDVGLHLKMAQERLTNRAEAAEQIELALRKFDLSAARNRGEDDPDDRKAESAMRASLLAALEQLRSPPQGRTERELQLADEHAVLETLGRSSSLAASIHRTIKTRQEAAIVKRRETMITVGLLCGAVILGAVLLGVLQYRSVLLPLNELGEGVRKIAAGEFQQRLDERGSREFAKLSSEFNRMAAELDEFYHRLEQKVAEKSRELIRSERLASVGYLAAGVAHEINNPLGIIAGYAEYSLSQLKQRASGVSDEEMEKSLQIICDESFRCKEIIGKLLSLARPGEGKREAINLGTVAADVAAAVGGLRDYRDRTLIVDADTNDNFTVEAIEVEMKQVVLNLTLNALEAVSPGGQVRIGVARDNGWVKLTVSDNGRGMNAQTLERVFEPFFTEKRGARQPGTGLGLSITHAIVETHGGQIHAHSEGPGKGSEFVVQLPAAQTDHGSAEAHRSVA